MQLSTTGTDTSTGGQTFQTAGETEMNCGTLKEITGETVTETYGETESNENITGSNIVTGIYNSF